MTLDLKPVELNLRVSPRLLRWIILIHGLTALVIVCLSLSFGINRLIVAVLILAVGLGCVYSYRKNQRLLWRKITFDGDQWSLSSISKKVVDSPVSVELNYYYRFGEIWVLGFRGIEGKSKYRFFSRPIVIPLFPDSCDEKSLRQLSQLLLMARH